MKVLRLRTAARLLTIIPIPWDDREAELTPAQTITWYPAVGLGIGGLLFGIMLLPMPVLPRAALCLIAWIAITGGLHEDGVMDCADAALAPVDAARRAVIRKDPHVGAHGLTVALLLMLARFAALTVAGPSVVLLAPIVGRWSMAITLAQLPPHPSSVLGATAARATSAVAASVSALLMIGGLMVWQHDAGPGAAAMAGVLGAFLVARWLVQRLGGASGDVHGAAGVVAETVTLYALLPW